MNMTETNTSSASAKRTQVTAGNMLPTRFPSSGPAKVLADSLSLLHATFHGSETVDQSTEYCELIKKIDNKKAILEKYMDITYVSTSLPFKTSLKSSLTISAEESFKDLNRKFEEAKSQFTVTATSLMKGVAVLEHKKLQNELAVLTARFIHKILVVNSVQLKTSREPDKLNRLLSFIVHDIRVSQSPDTKLIFFGV